MHLSLSNKTSRLPKRFPVGTTYVVEGHGGKDGSLRVFSRYVVLPDGQRINLGGDPAVAEEPAERSALGLEPKVVPGSAPSRARRPRSRTENPRQNSRKRRVVRPKKIVAGAGTSRRHGR